MVKPPQYEAMDGARVDAIPGAFEKVFGDSGNKLKVEQPHRSHQPRPGPIPRPTHHIFKGLRRRATIYPNGHIECFDDEIRGMLDDLSRIIEEAAAQAYNVVMGRVH